MAIKTVLNIWDKPMNSYMEIVKDLGMHIDMFLFFLPCRLRIWEIMTLHVLAFCCSKYL